MRDTAPIPGKERVLIPGDPERLARMEREKNGIPLIQGVVDDLLEVGEGGYEVVGFQYQQFKFLF